jgi:hypothetical protein
VALRVSVQNAWLTATGTVSGGLVAVVLPMTPWELQRGSTEPAFCGPESPE